MPKQNRREGDRRLAWSDTKGHALDYIVKRFGAPSRPEKWESHAYLFIKCFQDEVIAGGYSNVMPGSALSRQYGEKGMWQTKGRGQAWEIIIQLPLPESQRIKRLLAREWVDHVVGALYQRQAAAIACGIDINIVPELPPIRNPQIYDKAREKLQHASIAARLVALREEDLARFFAARFPRNDDRPDFAPDAEFHIAKLIRDEGVRIEAAVDCLSTILKGNQPAFPFWEVFHHPLSPVSRKSALLRNLKNNYPGFNIQMLHRKCSTWKTDSTCGWSTIQPILRAALSMRAR